MNLTHTSSAVLQFDNQRLPASEVTSQALKNIVNAVLARSDLFRGNNAGRDPLVILNLEHGGQSHRLSLRCAMTYFDGNSTLTLESNEAQDFLKVRALDLNLDSGAAQVKSVRVIQSNSNTLLDTALFNSRFEEKLALIGAISPSQPLLSSEQIWDPAIMNPISGQHLYVARANPYGRGVKTEEVAGVFDGIKYIDPSHFLMVGNSRIVDKSDIKYIAPILVFDSFNGRDFETTCGRPVDGLKDFFERMVPQGTLVQIDIKGLTESRKLIFNCISEDRAVFSSQSGLIAYKVRNNGQSSGINNVIILDQTGKEPKAGTYEILTPIFTNDNFVPTDKPRELEKD